MTRPAGVIAIAAVYGYGVFASVRYLLSEAPLRSSLERLAVVNILVGTVLIVALLRMHKWARWAVVVISAASLILAPLRIVLAHEQLYRIGVMVQCSFWAWAVWYLFQPHVKAAFRTA